MRPVHIETVLQLVWFCGRVFIVHLVILLTISVPEVKTNVCEFFDCSHDGTVRERSAIRPFIP
jgi:hypothetical protein